MATKPVWNRRAFIESRRKETIDAQPEWKELESILLGIGGEDIAYVYEEDLHQIIEHGEIFQTNNIEYMPGNISRCHQNVAALWDANKDIGVKIVTGWALSDDGTWRQHSWGLWKGHVVETTRPRTVYYGVVLSPKQAARFADNQL